ncbi:hypothetical protein BC629DRAFT_1590421 [Irpex lacteus]|nr:hypothetical protein BC629DRAFT_1590421 [Irpex lacteus]
MREIRYRHEDEVSQRANKEFAEKVEAKVAAARAPQIDAEDKDSHMASGDVGETQSPAPALSLLATVTSNIGPSPLSPFAPHVPSPLRQSFVPTVSLPTFANPFGLSVPSVATANALSQDVAASSEPTKLATPHTISVADPDDDYRPRIVVHAPKLQLVDDSDSDTLSDVSGDDEVDQLLDDTPPPSYAPGKAAVRHLDQLVERTDGRAARRIKKQVATRGRMKLRSGKVTGTPMTRIILPRPTLTRAPPLEEDGMLTDTQSPFQPLPSTFAPTFVPVEEHRDQEMVQDDSDGPGFIVDDRHEVQEPLPIPPPLPSISTVALVDQPLPTSTIPTQNPDAVDNSLPLNADVVMNADSSIPSLTHDSNDLAMNQDLRGAPYDPTFVGTLEVVARERSSSPSPSSHSEDSSLYYPPTPSTTSTDLRDVGILVDDAPSQDITVDHGIPTPPPDVPRTPATGANTVPVEENAARADVGLRSRLSIPADDLPRPANPTPNSLSLALGNPPTLSVVKTGTTNPILTHEFPYVETEPASPIEDTDPPEHPPYERLGGAVVDLPPVDELDHLSTTADVGHEDSDMTNSSSSLPSLVSVSMGSTLASTHEPPTPPEPLEDPPQRPPRRSPPPSSPPRVYGVVDREIEDYRFHLPAVSTVVERLAVNERSFEPPFGMCQGDVAVPETFMVPVLQPLRNHLQLRRHFCYVLEYAALVALDKGLNLYLEHLRSSFSEANLYQYHDVYHVRSEWTGNPFLYAIERFRLAQILRFFDDIDPQHHNRRLSSLSELIEEVLNVTVPARTGR